MNCLSLHRIIMNLFCIAWALLPVLSSPVRAAVTDVKCAVVQYTIKDADAVGTDDDRQEAFIRQAAAAGAKIIVTPETGFYRYSPFTENGVTMVQLAAEYNELKGRFTALARELDVCIVIGLREPHTSTTVYNTALFIGPDGTVLGKHHKMVPSSLEKSFTTAGTEANGDATPFSTPYGRVGMLICKDMDSNTWPDKVAAKGMDLFIGISGDPSRGWVKVVRGCQQAHCYGIGSNQYDSPSYQTGGNSGFVGPDGQMISEAGLGEKIIYQILPLPVEGADTTMAIVPVAVSTAVLPAGNVSAPYSAPLSATDGTAPYAWNVTGLPAGLSLNSGTITGVPVDSGTYTLTVTVTDAHDSTDSRELVLRVDPAEAVPAGSDRMEAEDMSLGNYTVDPQTAASGGKCIKASGTGTAQYQFNGTDGTYDLDVAYFDENDGNSDFILYVNDVQIDAWTADQDLGSASPDASTLVVRSVPDVVLGAGDRIKITGTADAGEFGRIDYIETVLSEADTVSAVRYNLSTDTAVPVMTGTVLFNHLGRQVGGGQVVPGVYFRCSENGVTKVLITE